MKTFEKGNITELQVQLELIKMGIVVFTPVNESSSVDLIIKINDKYQAIQVKTARKTPLGFQINLYSTSGGKSKKLYTEGTIDYFATFFKDQVYFIPFKEVEGKNIVTLRFDNIYKNQNKAFYAKNYLLGLLF